MKKTYQVHGMHCDSCALLIEEDLRDAGIQAVCNYKTNTLTVEMGKDVSDHQVLQIVQQAGYKLEAV